MAAYIGVVAEPPNPWGDEGGSETGEGGTDTGDEGTDTGEGEAGAAAADDELESGCACTADDQPGRGLG